MSDTPAPRSAKRKAMEVFAKESAEKERATKKRVVAKELRKKVDDLADLFGQMKSSDQHIPEDVAMMGEGRRRRKSRKLRRKSRKTRKHRK